MSFRPNIRTRTYTADSKRLRCKDRPPQLTRIVSRCGKPELKFGVCLSTLRIPGVCPPRTRIKVFATVERETHRFRWSSKSSRRSRRGVPASKGHRVSVVYREQIDFPQSVYEEHETVAPLAMNYICVLNRSTPFAPIQYLPTPVDVRVHVVLNAFFFIPKIFGCFQVFHAFSRICIPGEIPVPNYGPRP